MKSMKGITISRSTGSVMRQENGSIKLLVESKADLTGIQRRTGERKAATQMDFSGATMTVDLILVT